MPPPIGAMLGVAVPVAISSVALLAAWRPWMKGTRAGAWGTIAGVTLGFAGGAIAIQGFKGVLPVRSVTDYLPHVALVALAGGMLASGIKPAAARIVLGLLACVGATALITRIRPTAQLEPVALVTGAILLAMLVLWGCLALASRASGGARTPSALIVALTATSVAHVQSQTASLAQVCGSLAAALGPVMLLALWKPSLGVWRGATLPIAILAVSLLGAWRLTTFEVNPWSHAAALGALCAPALGILPPIRKARPWVGTLVVLLVAAGLGVLAVRLTPSGFDFSGLS